MARRSPTSRSSPPTATCSKRSFADYRLNSVRSSCSAITSTSRCPRSRPRCGSRSAPRSPVFIGRCRSCARLWPTPTPTTRPCRRDSSHDHLRALRARHPGAHDRALAGAGPRLLRRHAPADRRHAAAARLEPTSKGGFPWASSPEPSPMRPVSRGGTDPSSRCSILLIAAAYARLRRLAAHRACPQPFGLARNGQILLGTSDGDIATVDPTTGAMSALIDRSRRRLRPLAIERRTALPIRPEGRRRRGLLHRQHRRFRRAPAR